MRRHNENPPNIHPHLLEIPSTWYALCTFDVDIVTDVYETLADGESTSSPAGLQHNKQRPCIWALYPGKLLPGLLYSYVQIIRQAYPAAVFEAVTAIKSMDVCFRVRL
jgi:hypothetical protein